MKKLVVWAALSLVLTAVAVPQKLGEVLINDRTAILNQAAKLGEMTGVPMIGMAAAGALSSNPFSEDFGVPRDGAVTVVAAYGDSEQTALDLERDLELHLHWAVVYPATKDAAAFAAAKGLTATDGLFSNDGMMVAFSADNRWVVLGDDAASVKALLAEAGQAALPQGEVASVRLTEAGLTLIQKTADTFISTVATNLDADTLKIITGYLETLKQLKGLSLGLRVSDRGVDLLSTLAGRPGTEVDKLGREAIPAAAALAFAGKEALAAVAVAPNNGSTCDWAAEFEPLVALLKKYGLKFDYIQVEQNGTTLKVVVDVAACLAYFAKEGEALCEKIGTEGETMLKEFEALQSRQLGKLVSFKAAGPAMSCSLALKGQSLATTPAARLVKAMPEVAMKSVASVSVVSGYGLLRRLADAVLAGLTPEAGCGEAEVAMIRDLTKTLPTVEDGCMACATWRDGDRLVSLLRVTPDEIKGFSAIVKLALEALPSCGIVEIGEELPGDDEEKDDDDDDED